MRGKIFLVLGVLIGLAASLFFGSAGQDQKIPEKVVYYTTSSPTGEAEETEEDESSVTEEQAEKLKKLGFSAKLVPITTTIKSGGKKQ